MATTSEGLQNDTEEFFTPYDEVFDSFDAMGLHENLLKGIYAYGYEKPTAIQQRALVPFCKGLDVVLHAPSVSGNTATFCLGILQQLDYSIVQHQALILTPTKKLAKQFEKLMRALGKYLDVTVYSCDAAMEGKLHYQRIPEKGVHVVVGTPGRVLEMFRWKFLRADIIKMFVLFGADMLSYGFEDQIHDIFERLPPKIQVGVYSATMSPKELEISSKFMKSSVRILVKGDKFTLEGIKQFYVNTDEEKWKPETLLDLYETLAAVTKIILFIKSKSGVERLAKMMQERDHTVSAVHRGMDINRRNIILREFNSGASRVLITNDGFLPTCGIDFPQASVVINYDMPPRRQNYIQRIVRRSVAITFVNYEDKDMLTIIRTMYNTTFTELPLNFAELI